LPARENLLSRVPRVGYRERVPTLLKQLLGWAGRYNFQNRHFVAMFGLGENLDYYFCVGDVSMRKGIDALCGVIRHQMGRDPLSGEVFIFMSHDKTRVKLLQWQRGGFVLYYKRLERGRFELPFFNCKTQTYCLSWQILFMILEGISIKTVRFRERHIIHKRIANN